MADQAGCSEASVAVPVNEGTERCSRGGALGFKTGDGGEGHAGVELNLGLRDERAAVDWVVRWAGTFGGGGRRDAHGC